MSQNDIKPPKPNSKTSKQASKSFSLNPTQPRIKARPRIRVRNPQRSGIILLILHTDARPIIMVREQRARVQALIIHQRPAGTARMHAPSAAGATAAVRIERAIRVHDDARTAEGFAAAAAAEEHAVAGGVVAVAGAWGREGARDAVRAVGFRHAGAAAAGEQAGLA